MGATKQGSSSPLDAWMAGRWRWAVEATLDWGEANIPLFDYALLRRLHALNIADGGLGRVLWNPFVFLAWAQTHRCEF